MICWLNGAFLDIASSRIDPRDRGFLLGDGVFETMLAEAGLVRRVRRHLARLHRAAELLAIPLPFKDDEILDAMQHLLVENQCGQGRAALRLTLTRGVGARGVTPPDTPKPLLLITAASAPPPPEHLRVILATYVRNEKSISSRIKSLNYLDNIMARREAALRGADEALMCNSAGALAGASAANVFVVYDNVIFTPSLDEGALPGVMRAVVIDAAKDLNIPLREARIDLAALDAAAEIFLTNALIGVCPLVEIDGRAIKPGSLTGALRQRAAKMD